MARLSRTLGGALRRLREFGDAAACSGAAVVVEGVVTGDFAELNGVYVQEEPGDVDTDAATSEGVFVFLGTDYGGGAAPVGTLVRVAGTVGEYVTSGGASQTQLSGATVTPLGDAADGYRAMDTRQATKVLLRP